MNNSTGWTRLTAGSRNTKTKSKDGVTILKDGAQVAKAFGSDEQLNWLDKADGWFEKHQNEIQDGVTIVKDGAQIAKAFGSDEQLN